MLNVTARLGAPRSFADPHPETTAATARQDGYIRAHDFDRPTMVFDLAVLRAKYRALDHGLGDASIHYAVKANPAPEVIAALAAEGARFDAASRGEIDLCLSLGVPAEHVAFGNTIKRAVDIAHAHAVGVRQFAADFGGRAGQDRRERAGRAGDHPHAGRVLGGRLAADAASSAAPRARRCG